MKCVITILQNKRVAMPYIFGRYVLPMMRQCITGEVKLFHIFHDGHNTSAGKTNSAKMRADRVDMVKAHISSGSYPEAIIRSHKRTCDFHPVLPSLQLAVQVALEEQADFHLWLEDDAIVYDQDCGTWATTLASGDAGLYADTDKKQLINTAYFLSTREYDQRFNLLLQEFQNRPTITANKGRWDDYAGRGSLIEHVAWRAARRPVYLGPGKMFRHHPYARHTKTAAMVKEWLRNNIKGITKPDLDLLALDFEDAA